MWADPGQNGIDFSESFSAYGLTKERIIRLIDQNVTNQNREKFSNYGPHAILYEIQML